MNRWIAALLALLAGTPDAPLVGKAWADAFSSVAPFIPSNTVAFTAGGSGVTDDTADIQSALNALSTAGGGTLMLGAKRYVIGTTADLTIPANTAIACAAPLIGNSNPTNYLTTKSALILGASHKVTMSAGSGWYYCALLSGAITINPNTTREELTVQNAFGGIGIQTSGDVTISRAFIGGFATGIYSFHGARTHIIETNIDATICVNSDHSHDITHIVAVHCFPFMTSGSANTTVSAAVSAAADNGSGLYRLTTATNAIATGDTVYVQGLSGAQSANGKFVATAVDATHVDLQGSQTAANTPTGNISSGSKIIANLSSMANIAVGSPVSGAGIPASTTIVAVSAATNSVIMSANATATTTGLALTFTDTAYVSGGFVWLDASQRNGDGFVFTNSETTICTDCFAYGHTVGFHAGAGMSWLTVQGAQVDEQNSLQDPTTICIKIDGSSLGSVFQGGSTQGCGTALVVNSTGNSSHIIDGMTLNNTNNAGPVAEFDQGRVSFNGNASPVASRYILVLDTVTNVAMNSNDLSNLFAFQTAAGQNKMFAAGNMLAASTFAGNFVYNGLAKFGNSGCNMQGCGLQIAGTWSNGTVSTTTITAGGTTALSGNASEIVLHATGTLATYTVTLPGPSVAGQQYDIYFDQAVTAMTFAAATGAITAPTTVAANSWHHCSQNLSLNNWYCN